MAPCSAHVRPYARFDKKEAEDGNRGETWELDKNGATCMCSRDGLSEIYMRRFRNVLVVTGKNCALISTEQHMGDRAWRMRTTFEVVDILMSMGILRKISGDTTYTRKRRRMQRETLSEEAEDSDPEEAIPGPPAELVRVPGAKPLDLSEYNKKSAPLTARFNGVEHVQMHESDVATGGCFSSQSGAPRVSGAAPWRRDTSNGTHTHLSHQIRAVNPNSEQ
eukprot:4493467-Prymnesium_polylepis.2